MFKINIEQLSAKFKFGQGLNQQRFQMLIDNLQKRDTKMDLLTIKAMHRYRPEKYKC
jgi:predicted FMN-binding regulatory protein PaiB